MDGKISCPACGREQDPSGECVWCGVVFSKYKSKQNTRRESPRPPHGPFREPVSEKDKKEARPVSVHRAFVYSAALPGWGEIHAGSRVRGAVTLALFLFFAIWFTWTFASLASSAANWLLAGIEGRSMAMLPDLPTGSLLISMFGMYVVWLWAMISSVDIAVRNRRSTNAPEQSNTIWGVVFSWLCPGAGQLYTGAGMGYLILLSHVLAIFLILPVYAELTEKLSAILQNGKSSYSDPFAAAALAKELSSMFEFSFANILLTMVRLLAIALTVNALKHRFEIREKILAFIALLTVGWLCPGSGQIHMGRGATGWWILFAYIGSLFMIRLLLQTGMIPLKEAETVAWIPTLIQWGAMIEAPVRATSAASS